MKTLNRTLLMTAVATCLASGAYAEGYKSTAGSDSEAYNSGMNASPVTDTSATQEPAGNMAQQPAGSQAAVQQDGSAQASSATQQASPLTTAAIMDAQESLKGEGYDVAVDGVMGQGTMEAIREFQRENNLTATGTLNSETLAALDIDDPSAAQGER